MDNNNKIITTTTQSLRYLTTFFLSFDHQQLGKLRAVLNRLVFLFGFSNDSKKTNALFFTPYYPERIKRLDIYIKMWYNVA